MHRKSPCDPVSFNQDIQHLETDLLHNLNLLRAKVQSETEQAFPVPPEELRDFYASSLEPSGVLEFLKKQINVFDIQNPAAHVARLFQYALNGLIRLRSQFLYLQQLKKIIALQDRLEMVDKYGREVKVLCSRLLNTEADCFNFLVKLRPYIRDDAKLVAEVDGLQRDILECLNDINHKCLDYRYTLNAHLQANAEERLLVDNLLREIDSTLDAEMFVVLPTEYQEVSGFHARAKELALRKLSDPLLDQHIDLFNDIHSKLIKFRRAALQELVQQLKPKIANNFFNHEVGDVNEFVRSLVLDVMFRRLIDNWVNEEKKILLRWYVRTPRLNMEFHGTLQKMFDSSGGSDLFNGREIIADLNYLHSLSIQKNVTVNYSEKLDQLKSVLSKITDKLNKDKNYQLANQFHPAMEILNTFLESEISKIADADLYLQTYSDEQRPKLDDDTLELIYKVRQMVTEVVYAPLSMQKPPKPVVPQKMVPPSEGFAGFFRLIFRYGNKPAATSANPTATEDLSATDNYARMKNNLPVVPQRKYANAASLKSLGEVPPVVGFAGTSHGFCDEKKESGMARSASVVVNKPKL